MNIGRIGERSKEKSSTESEQRAAEGAENWLRELADEILCPEEPRTQDGKLVVVRGGWPVNV